MRLNCRHVSAGESGGEIFQVLFEEKEDQCDEPYVLIQRAWLEEDEGEFSPIYVETNDQRLTGHYRKVDAVLTRSHLTLRTHRGTHRVRPGQWTIAIDGGVWDVTECVACRVRGD